jgi:transposase-like protein
MNKKELEAFAREAAKSIKTEKDLSDFSQMLTKVTVEAALNIELDEHLGYRKIAHPRLKIVGMAFLVRHSERKRDNLRLIFPVIVRVTLNHNG